ncbi:MAG: UbiA family prenyltransferase [Vicinamibacterales bacterium]
MTPSDLPPAAPARPRRAWSDYLELTKPRLNLLVILTTLAGYYLGMPDGAPVMLLVHTVVGTTLVAGGASVLNQVWEKDTDRLMRRTRRRPLPDDRLRPGRPSGSASPSRPPASPSCGGWRIRWRRWSPWRRSSAT